MSVYDATIVLTLADLLVCVLVSKAYCYHSGDHRFFVWPHFYVRFHDQLLLVYIFYYIFLTSYCIC